MQKGPLSLPCLNVMKSNLTLNAINENLSLNAMNENLTLNATNTNLTLNAMNATNTNLTLNAMNANLTLNASAIKHRSANSKVKISATNAVTVRSRYVKFICDKNLQCDLINYQHKSCLTRQYQRDREPSRIPAKKICRLLTKSRKLRKSFRNKIKRNIPDSSCVYRYTQAFSHECQRVLSCKCFDQFIKTKINWKSPFVRKHKKDAIESRCLKLNCRTDNKKRQEFHNNEVDFVKTENFTYKDLNHNFRVNYCKLFLCGDIETNPGPTFNNPVKTIHAPYSQGNVDVFGQNAGRQCVPMSLCALIYLYRNDSIRDSSDLVNIMNVGNQLYSTLSRLSRQMYLLLEELPTLITVEDTNYSIELSQRYW